MENTKLFSMAIGIETPWYIDKMEFKNKENGRRVLEIYIDFNRGTKFNDKKGIESKIHDTVERKWRHLNFFEHECYLHARVPRIKTSEGKVENVELPWSRSNSGFTLMFEAFAMLLLENEMPVNKAARILKVYPHRLWTIFNYWINLAISQDNQKGVTSIGIDETSRKKGHDYLTVAVDLSEKRVVFVTKGKDETTIDRLKEHLGNKEVLSKQIEHVGIDMSPAFIKGVKNNFPTAQIIFDRFHIVKMLNDSMDKVRKEERRKHKELKGHKYTFLKNNKNLTKNQKSEKEELIELYPQLGEAYRLKELFNDFWSFTDYEQAVSFLAYWCDLVLSSNVTHFKDFVKTINRHWDGIINYINSKISNGILEGINSKIQLAKRRARGFRNINNFINMVYFIAGKLNFNYPLYST